MNFEFNVLNILPVKTIFNLVNRNPCLVILPSLDERLTGLGYFNSAYRYTVIIYYICLLFVIRLHLMLSLTAFGFRSFI